MCDNVSYNELNGIFYSIQYSYVQFIRNADL